MNSFYDAGPSSNYAGFVSRDAKVVTSLTLGGFE